MDTLLAPAVGNWMFHWACGLLTRSEPRFRYTRRTCSFQHLRVHSIQPAARRAEDLGTAPNTRGSTTNKHMNGYFSKCMSRMSLFLFRFLMLLLLLLFFVFFQAAVSSLVRCQAVICQVCVGSHLNETNAGLIQPEKAESVTAHQLTNNSPLWRRCAVAVSGCQYRERECFLHFDPFPCRLLLSLFHTGMTAQQIYMFNECGWFDSKSFNALGLHTNSPCSPETNCFRRTGIILHHHRHATQPLCA